MIPLLAALLVAQAGPAASAQPGEPAAGWTGPGRFCGYAPIIDLLPGERIALIGGGVHGGSFEWHGAFGRLDVSASGWASRPRGGIERRPTRTGQARFAQRRDGARYVVAIWNRRQGAAYFSSPSPLTPAQLAAIDRVNLFQEGETPGRCDFCITFSWE